MFINNSLKAKYFSIYYSYSNGYDKINWIVLTINQLFSSISPILKLLHKSSIYHKLKNVFLPISLYCRQSIHPNMKVALNDKKVISAWALYDWANSAYALVISTAIFPVYFYINSPQTVNFLGMDLANTAMFSYSVSFSFLVIAFLSPLLSGIADYSGRRMFYLKFFTILGSIACLSMFFFNGPEDVWIGLITFILASIGYAGGVVFYNSYLPEIASEDQFDKVSAKGFAYGYLGSVLLLIANLVIIQKPAWFGITDERLPYQIAFMMVGIWWLFFAFVSFRNFPKDRNDPLTENVIKKGLVEIKKAFNKIWSKRDLKFFLCSYFFYTAGVNTVIYLATTFAKEEINMETGELILTVLVIQIVGIIGAYFFAFVSGKKGNKISIGAMLFIWIVICIMAYFVTAKIHFYVIAALVGLVMGGIQSQSRSVYSKLIEERGSDLASYYSFYDILTKVAVVVGTFFFGIVAQLTGSLRNSVLVLVVFFVLGLIFLSASKMRGEDGLNL